MFCSLSLTSLLLVQRISAMFHRTRRQHKLIKAALIVGSLLITLTGCFPERYDLTGKNDGALGILCAPRASHLRACHHLLLACR